MCHLSDQDIVNIIVSELFETDGQKGCVKWLKGQYKRGSTAPGPFETKTDNTLWITNLVKHVQQPNDSAFVQYAKAVFIQYTPIFLSYAKFRGSPPTQAFWCLLDTNPLVLAGPWHWEMLDNIDFNVLPHCQGEYLTLFCNLY
jgi:hypothetical protein